MSPVLVFDMSRHTCRPGGGELLCYNKTRLWRDIVARERRHRSSRGVSLLSFRIIVFFFFLSFFLFIVHCNRDANISARNVREPVVYFVFLIMLHRCMANVRGPRTYIYLYIIPLAVCLCDYYYIRIYLTLYI